MDIQLLTLGAIGAYVLMMIGLGVYGARKEDHAGFVIGNRNVGMIPMAMSLGSSARDLAFITFWVIMGYTQGYGYLWLFPVTIASVIAIGFFANGLRERARKENFVTAGQWIEADVGRMTRIAMSAFIVAYGVFWSAAQIYVMGQILSSTLALENYILLPLITGTIFVYLCFGGFMNVIRTDILQTVIILCFLSLPFFITIPAEDLYDFGSFFTFDPVDFTAIAILSFIGVFAIGEVWQKIFSARDERALKYGFPMGGLFVMLLTTGGLLLGLAARSLYPGENPEELLGMFFNPDVIPAIVVIALPVILIALGMSTVDTQAFLFSSTVIRDFFRINPETNRAKYILYTRIGIAAMLAAVTVMALSFEGIMDVLMGILGMYVIGAPVFMAMFYLRFKKSRLIDIGFTASIIIGFAVFLAMQITGWGTQGFIYALIPVSVAYVVVGGTLLLNKMVKV